MFFLSNAHIRSDFLPVKPLCFPLSLFHRFLMCTSHQMYNRSLWLSAEFHIFPRMSLFLYRFLIQFPRWN